jgi:hypothetical protein
MFIVSTIQRSHNCGMPQTFFTFTWRCVIMTFFNWPGGSVQPAGLQPVAGMR